MNLQCINGVLTAFDESGVVGHLILRFTDEEQQTIRFGFVIVDDAKRGKGYGKEMYRARNEGGRL